MVWGEPVVVDGVNVTEQAPPESVQVVEEKAPAPEDDQVTVPVGEEPVTVAVHVDAVPIATEAGRQDTAVVVEVAVAGWITETVTD